MEYRVQGIGYMVRIACVRQSFRVARARKVCEEMRNFQKKARRSNFVCERDCSRVVSMCEGRVFPRRMGAHLKLCFT
jgi:hypothetical protein